MAEALAEGQHHAGEGDRQADPLQAAQPLGRHPARQQQRHPERRGVEEHREPRRAGVLQPEVDAAELAREQRAGQQAARQRAVALEQRHAAPRGTRATAAPPRPVMRIAACHSGGTSVTVVLIRICCRPQNAQQATSREMARVSRWVLRSVMCRGVSAPPSASQRVRDGSPDHRGVLGHDCAMHATIPIIDIAALATRDATARARVAAEVGAACRDVGFFAVTGHGVPAALIDDAFAASARSSRSTSRAKQALAIDKLGHNRGYVGLGVEALDEKNGGRPEGSLQPDLDRRAVAPAQRLAAARRLARARAGATSTRCSLSARRLHAAFASTWACRRISSPTRSTARWPRCACCTTRRPRRRRARTAQIGAGTHTDYGNVTLLATDGVAGLQVRTPRRRLGRRARGARRLHLQHRRLPDALDQRRLRVDAAPRACGRDARALFDRALPRPEPRRGGERDSVVRARGRGAAPCAGHGAGLPAVALRRDLRQTVPTRAARADARCRSARRGTAAARRPRAGCSAPPRRRRSRGRLRRSGCG